jgi:hypothetical protein
MKAEDVANIVGFLYLPSDEIAPLGGMIIENIPEYYWHEGKWEKWTMKGLPTRVYYRFDRKIIMTFTKESKKNGGRRTKHRHRKQRRRTYKK